MKAGVWKFLVILLFCSIQFLQAQEPGYLGRRFWAGYDNYSNLGLFGQPYGKVNSPEEPSFFLNLRHSFHAEYALAPRWSVGVNFQTFRTGKLIKSPFTYRENIHAQMRLKGLGLSLRWYALRNRGSVAPLGSYGQLDVVRYLCEFTDPNGLFFTNGETELGTYPTTGVFFTFGRTFLFGDRLIWDFGFQSGFSPGWFSVITTGAGANYRAKLRNSVHYRTTGHYLMNFRAGLSFILF